MSRGQFPSPVLTYIIHEKAHVKRKEYGDLNSKIGDMPLAITYEERNSPEQERYMVYRAYFEAGNAAYEVFAQGVTQREFIDLLISIYASPRPETRNFFDVIMPNAGD